MSELDLRTLALAKAGISKLSKEIDAELYTVNGNLIAWRVGAFYSTDGNLIPQTDKKDRMRTDLLEIYPMMSVKVADGYKVSWYAWDRDQKFLGWRGEWSTEGFEASEILAAKPTAVYFRLILAKAVNGNMNVETDREAVSITLHKIRNLDTYSMPFKMVSYDLMTINGANGTILRDYINRATSEHISITDWPYIIVDEGFLIALRFYDAAGAYIGYNENSEKIFGKIDVRKYAPTQTHTYRFVVMRTDDTALSTADVEITEKITVCRPHPILNHMFAEAVASDRTDVFIPENWGLPVLYLTGDTLLMTKDNAVELNYTYGTRKGTCTCKWQGSSSVRLGYPKRNYTIKFGTAFEAQAGWGVQNKYCLKANWIDPSGLRNVVNAKLWGQVVATRNLPETDKRTVAPNYGAIDGFPIVLMINGEFEGLYTWNVPKDGWMFAMGEGSAEYVMCSEDNAKPASLFKATAVCDETDYSIEYLPDGVDDATAISSFNTLISAAVSAGADWENTLAPYMDVDSVIDYFIFVNCINGHDNHGKNILYGTYDGVKWFMSAYDLDTTYGSNPYGKEWFRVVNDRCQFAESANMHRLAALMYNHSKARVKARYQQLRATVLSDANVWHTFANFATQIPKGLYNMDADKWPTMPGTTMANIATYMDFYRMHCAYLDKEVEGWNV